MYPIDEFEYEDVQELRGLARMMDDEAQDNPQPSPEPPVEDLGDLPVGYDPEDSTTH